MTQLAEAPRNSGNNGTTGIVKRAYQPLAQIGSSGALKGLLESQRDSIAQALPKHVTPERLIKTLLVAANRTPDLLQCTQASILETVNRAAELGLDLSGTLGEAYPVPFNNKVKIDGREEWVKQCQLIIGYRGLVKLARQSGEVKRIDADVVCENDEFVFRKGSDAKCEFIPNLKGDRGEVVGAYAYVQFKDGGEQFDFMPYSDIEKVRQRSKSGSTRDGQPMGAWKSDWPEMAKKTIFRRVAKWLPLSTEKLVRAMEQDDADYGLADVLEAHAGPAGRTKLDTILAGANQQQALPETQLDESEAEEYLKQRTAESGSSDSPSSAQEQNDARGGGEGEQSQEPDPFDVRKGELFDAMKGNGHTQESAQKAWENFLLGHTGCGGKNGDERKLPDAAWKTAMEAAQANRGKFVSPN